MAEEIKEVMENDNAITESTSEPVQETEETTEAENPDTQQEATTEAKPGQSGNRGAEEYHEHVQNWRSLREKAERAERAERELENLKKQLNGQPKDKQENITLNDDDLAEGKHLKYYQQNNEQRFAQLESQLVEAQIKASYPDFDKVVNPDTVGMLRDTDPELAESLALNPNLRSKAVATYKAIKRYGLAGPTYEKQKEVITKNSAKPRTATSVSPQHSDSPLSRVNAFVERLTDERKSQIYAEMQDILKDY